MGDVWTALLIFFYLIHAVVHFDFAMYAHRYAERKLGCKFSVIRPFLHAALWPVSHVWMWLHDNGKEVE